MDAPGPDRDRDDGSHGRSAGGPKRAGRRRPGGSPSTSPATGSSSRPPPTPSSWRVCRRTWTRTSTREAERSRRWRRSSRRSSARRRRSSCPPAPSRTTSRCAPCAGSRRRVIVQDVSHLANDSGDCAQQLSQLTLVPLAPGKATFAWEEAARAIERSAARPRAHAGRRDLDRVARAAAARRDVRLRRDAAHRRRGPGAGHRPPPRRRAAVRRVRLFGTLAGGVRGALRHGLRLALEVLQRGGRRDPGGAGDAARGPLPGAAHVRRRALERVAVRGRRARTTPTATWSGCRRRSPRRRP